MKNGFIKFAAITPQISVGDTKFNTENIINSINAAEKEGASVVVFPELSITGSTCGDMFESDTLLNAALTSLKEIAAATSLLNIVAIVGLPIRFDFKIYNCAAAIQAGEILGIVPK